VYKYNKQKARYMETHRNRLKREKQGSRNNLSFSEGESQSRSRKFESPEPLQ
jgi:hypothetical protein